MSTPRTTHDAEKSPSLMPTKSTTQELYPPATNDDGKNTPSSMPTNSSSQELYPPAANDDGEKSPSTILTNSSSQELHPPAANDDSGKTPSSVAQKSPQELYPPFSEGCTWHKFRFWYDVYCTGPRFAVDYSKITATSAEVKFVASRPKQTEVAFVKFSGSLDRGLMDIASSVAIKYVRYHLPWWMPYSLNSRFGVTGVDKYRSLVSARTAAYDSGLGVAGAKEEDVTGVDKYRSLVAARTAGHASGFGVAGTEEEDGAGVEKYPILFAGGVSAHVPGFRAACAKEVGGVEKPGCK